MKIEPKLILIILPSIFGYLSGTLCNVKDTSGSTVNFRPKPITFSIAWIILYILIGLSWYYASLDTTEMALNTLFHLLLNLGLCSWIYFYSCKKQKINGIYALIFSFTCALLCYTIGNTTSKLLIVPLIGWILFATLINVGEVEKM